MKFEKYVEYEGRIYLRRELAKVLFPTRLEQLLYLFGGIK